MATKTTTNHRHNHTPECEHKNLAYCKTCKVPHCLDCNKEWREYNWVTSTMPYYQKYQQLGDITYTGNSAGTLQAAKDMGQILQEYYRGEEGTLKVNCNHTVESKS